MTLTFLPWTSWHASGGCSCKWLKGSSAKVIRGQDWTNVKVMEVILIGAGVEMSSWGFVDGKVCKSVILLMWVQHKLHVNISEMKLGLVTQCHLVTDIVEHIWCSKSLNVPKGISFLNKSNSIACPLNRKYGIIVLMSHINYVQLSFKSVIIVCNIAQFWWSLGYVTSQTAPPGHTCLSGCGATRQVTGVVNPLCSGLIYGK